MDRPIVDWDARAGRRRSRRGDAGPDVAIRPDGRATLRIHDPVASILRRGSPGSRERPPSSRMVAGQTLIGFRVGLTSCAWAKVWKGAVGFWPGRRRQARDRAVRRRAGSPRRKGGTGRDGRRDDRRLGRHAPAPFGRKRPAVPAPPRSVADDPTDRSRRPEREVGAGDRWVRSSTVTGGGVAERHRRFLIRTKAADRLEDQADAVPPGGSIGAMLQAG